MGGRGAEFYTKCHQLEKEYGQGHDSNIVSDDATQHKSDYGEYVMAYLVRTGVRIEGRFSSCGKKLVLPKF